MSRTSLHSVPITVIAALAVAFVACGRTGLDSPFADAGGKGGAGGRFPAGGTGGGFATGGAGGFATGGAGGFATGGAGGFATGGAGGFATGGAGGGRVRLCVDGANSCADELTAQVCIDGAYVPFPCAMGCFGGVCTECVPGTSTCATPNATQLCGADGVVEPPEPCPGACVNGACVVDCAEGATRCASHEGQQTCKGGQWLPAVDCPFVCVDDACGMDPKHVFVTSQVFVGGDLGGLTGADDLCRKLAVNAGLSSSYFAWLSDDTGSPAARFSQDAGPYVLVDGTIVANNWTDLTMGGMLRHPIDLTETGGAPPIGTAGVGCTAPFVWTNTNVDGSRYGTEASCDDWSNPMSPTALFGSTALIVEWSDMCTATSADGTPTCAGTAPLYCFEQ